MVTLEHDTRHVDDVRLHYVRAGSGAPVVLLHGWPQTWYAWRRVIPLLAERFEVVAVDMPGFGESSMPADGFDKKTVSARVRALVRQLDLGPVHLVGHDMGAQVAYSYAAQFPDEVASLVFMEATLPAFGQEPVMDVAHGGSWHFGFNMAGDISEELVRGRERLLVEHWMRRSAVGAVDPSTVEDGALEVYAHALAQPGGLRCSFGYYRTLPQDRRDNADLGRTRLSMPVLAVDADRGFPDGALNAMRLVADHVEHVEIERCGHYPAEERPQQVAAAIETFVAGVAARR